MPDYPYTIENGAGEQITFLRRVKGPAGDRLELENLVHPGGGPPMHVHYHQEEGLTVLEGRLAYQRPGQAPVYVEAGQTVSFKPGEPHKFWNAGEGPLRCTGYIEPAHNVEYFLGALYAAQRRNGGKRPDPFDAAFLALRYRSEFGMVEIPELVQRLVFPVQVAIGRLLGRYEKYADAPAPLRP